MTSFIQRVHDGGTFASPYQLLGWLASNYWRRTAIALALLLIGGIAEGFSLVSLLPVLDIAISDSGGSGSQLASTVSGWLQSLGVPRSLPLLLTILVAGLMIKGGLTLLALRQVGYGGARVARDLRLRVIKALMQARSSFFTGQRSGAIATALGTEPMHGGAAYMAMAQVGTNALQTFIYLAIAMSLSWQWTLGALLLGTTLVLLLGRLTRLGYGAGERHAVVLRSLVSRLTESISAIKPLKAMASERRLAVLMAGEANELEIVERRKVISSAAMQSLYEPILAIFLGLGLYASLVLWTTPFSDVLFIALLFYRLITRIGSMQSNWLALSVQTGHMRAFWRTVREAEAAREILPPGDPPRFSREIALDKVCVRYGEHQVLDNVSLNIRKGELTTLAGPSGAGKTTIADVAIGVLAPSSGLVRLDDAPMSGIDQTAWRHMVGYVPQEALLFHDTVLANVTLDDPSISEDDARHALELAGAWDFVAARAGGLMAVVGERGSQLSGGQRQRIAIARALARRPSLLVLDEPTSGLDTASEAHIVETIRELADNVTVLAITHQSALVDVADAVWHVVDGRATLTKSTARPRRGSGTASHVVSRQLDHI